MYRKVSASIRDLIRGHDLNEALKNLERVGEHLNIMRLLFYCISGIFAILQQFNGESRLQRSEFSGFERRPSAPDHHFFEVAACGPVLNRNPRIDSSLSEVPRSLRIKMTQLVVGCNEIMTAVRCSRSTDEKFLTRKLITSANGF